MRRILFLMLVLIKQAFSGEFTGGDKMEIKRIIPVIDKGEVTGADKPKPVIEPK